MLRQLSVMQFAAALTLGILLADEFAGRYVMLGIFYLFPVVLATWARGIKAGLLWSVGAVGLSFIVTRLVGSPFADDIYLVVALVGQFVAFVVAALLAAYTQRVHNDLRSMARVDFLTGAANRMAFQEAANALIHLNERRGVPFAIMYLDCDGFKSINDTRGHPAGDRLLVTVAKTLKHYTRRFDTVARLGGDEFSVLLHGVDESAELIGVSIQGKLNEAMRAESFNVTFSIGIAVFSEPPRSADEVLATADALMYRVKHTGKAQVVVERVSAAAKPDHSGERHDERNALPLPA